MTVALHSFGELVMRHKGARICVMGGAKTLAAEIEQVWADVWISANAHGAKLRKVDYVVAMDNLHTVTREQMEDLIRPHTNAPIIGPWQWSDYGITNYPLSPRLLFSGVIAQWAASMMGGHPVILAGMDCYGASAGRPFDQHQAIAPHIRAQVRVCGDGPLTRLWPRYDPDETFAEYVVPDALDMGKYMPHGVYVQVRKPVEIRGQTYPIGCVLHLPLAEVHRQIKHRSLIEIDPPEAQTVTRRQSRRRAPAIAVAV